MEDHTQIFPWRHPSGSRTQMVFGPNGLRELQHPNQRFCPALGDGSLHRRKPREVEDPELKADLFYPRC